MSSDINIRVVPFVKTPSTSVANINTTQYTSRGKRNSNEYIHLFVSKVLVKRE